MSADVTLQAVLGPLRALLEDPDARGEYLAVGDGPSRLDVAAVENLPGLLAIAEKAGELREALESKIVLECGRCASAAIKPGLYPFSEHGHHILSAGRTTYCPARETRATLAAFDAAVKGATA